MNLRCLQLLPFVAALGFVAPAGADEPAPTITQHRYVIGGRVLGATAEIGRIAIRDEKSGAVRGTMGFTA